ncbi:aspartyl aminopeptidase isoform X1 [Lates japonicus]|uniref:Aspartyl aminopeptidase isoform X1 n=1 Tax=Lates japonicus TaxID=270547 RepID=A0AAD3NK97_LATJO|nr:aspartyl aminopeptidase isoform X1 [Lates japonicus]
MNCCTAPPDRQSLWRCGFETVAASLSLLLLSDNHSLSVFTVALRRSSDFESPINAGKSYKMIITVSAVCGGVAPSRELCHFGQLERKRSEEDAVPCPVQSLIMKSSKEAVQSAAKEFLQFVIRGGTSII